MLEHLNDLSAVMGEIHRICQPEGTVYIEVPHHSSWCANTPDHKLRFGYLAFDGYREDMKTWRTGRKFKVLKREITFHRSFRRVFLHKLSNSCPMGYERFWTYMFPAENFKIGLRPIK